MLQIHGSVSMLKHFTWGATEKKKKIETIFTSIK